MPPQFRHYILFGTPRFAAIILQDLLEKQWIPSAVVCNPDKPAGRKRILTSPPVKEIAASQNIPVLQPEKVDLAFIEKLKTYNPAFFIVAAYGKIIPKKLISLPPLGTIGVHPSLLPHHRGPTPIQNAILEGDTETGVTLFLVDEKVDHGAILTQQSLPLSGTETYLELETELARLASNLLDTFLPRFIASELTPLVQDETNATYTKKFATEDAFLGNNILKKAVTSETAKKMLGTIRALNPEPGAYTIGAKGKRIKILEAKILGNMLVPTKIQEEGRKVRQVMPGEIIE